MRFERLTALVRGPRPAAPAPGPLTLALLVAAAAAALVSAQGGRALPRMPLPEAPPQEREPPRFRASVTRVEVSALVLGRDGAPVRGLTAADFEVLENGVAQTVRSFVPFTYQPELVVLPDPLPPSGDPARPPASMPASNYYSSSSRVFALVLDDLHVDVRRTQTARAAARRLVEQLTPADLLLVVSTASSESTGYFARDRQHALRMIERFTGQRLPDKTLASLRFAGQDFEPERLDHYERLCATIRNVAVALRDVSGRRKTVVLVTEGSSFGAGLSDMTVTIPSATGGGRVTVPAGASRAMNEALAAAAAGNIAIYPLNPAGLDVADADVIQAPGLVRGELKEDRYAQILTEARQSSEMSRDLAALTGGVSLVDTNDALAGIDRAVRDASAYYVLTYEPSTPPRGNDYRRIEVKVRRPGVRVLARRGYRPFGTPPPPPMKLPDTVSPQLRSLLAGVLMDDALPSRVQAVPVARRGGTATIAVIVEVNGTAFASDRQARALKVEQGLLTINGSGKASNGTRRVFDVSLSAEQWDVLAATGLRSVWAIELPAGRHQLRVASVDVATGRGGSVYLTLDVPRQGEAMVPSILVASRVLSMMPTVFADQKLTRWTTAMPTASRVFPEGDELTVTVPDAADGPVAARLLTPAGDLVWHGSVAASEAAPAQFVVPLEKAGCDVCDLEIESAGRRGRTTIGIVRPQTAKPAP